MAGARAAAGVAEARIAVDSAEREAIDTRAALASLWAGAPDFSMPGSTFAAAVQETHDHDGSPETNPDVARAAANRDRASAAVRLERSRGYQDPTISLGVRRFEETGESGVVAGVSIPLGIFDRNRGGIAQAEAERRRSEYELTAARLELSRRYDALTRTRDGAIATVRALEADVIPQAERALALAQNGYDRGAFSYLDVLEAQRALTDAREQRVQALLSFHRNEAELDRLTARFADAEPE
ncbi:MAG: TolC family protein [Hyphomonadaceae bacterium]